LSNVERKRSDDKGRAEQYRLKLWSEEKKKSDDKGRGTG